MATETTSGQGRVAEVGLAFAVIFGAWLLQLTVVSAINLRDVICSLPLTFTIVWGSIFGSRLPPLTPEEVRNSSLSDVMLRQAVGGSLSGALVGATFGALYVSVAPAYPIAYPIIGWIAGYFCLKNFSQGWMLCILVVFLSTILAETITAGELAVIGKFTELKRPDLLTTLVQTAVPEAAINSLIAPLIFFPLRAWQEFSEIVRKRLEQ